MFLKITNNKQKLHLPWPKQPVGNAKNLEEFEGMKEGACNIYTSSKESSKNFLRIPLERYLSGDKAEAFHTAVTSISDVLHLSN